MRSGNSKLTPAECFKRIAWILFVIIIGYLLIASIFSSCYLGKYRYATMSGGSVKKFVSLVKSGSFLARIKI